MPSDETVKWLRLYAKAREALCSCNVVPEEGYNYICDWCEDHPEGNWDEVAKALEAHRLSKDEPFARLETTDER